MTRSNQRLNAAKNRFGASGEVSLLGYTATFVAALMSVASLGPPRVGGQMLVHLRERMRELVHRCRIDRSGDLADLAQVQSGV